MPSTQSFVEYVCEQAGGARTVAFRKMFGEYALYCDGKVVALICREQVFVKPTAAGRRLVPTVAKGPPYPGAKPCLVVTDCVDDRKLMAALFAETADALPAPKPKRKRGPRRG